MNIIGKVKNVNTINIKAGSPESYEDGIDLTATLFQPIEGGISEKELESENDAIEGSETDPTSFNFDHTTLKRLTTKQEYPLVVTVPQTYIEVENGDDLSDYLMNFSLSFPLSGVIEGNFKLEGIPKDLEVNTGDKVNIKQCWYSLEGTENCMGLGSFYVISSPKRNSDTSGVTSLDVEIGDELAYHGKRARTPIKKYCGPKPTNTSQAAEIYADTRGLFTKEFPIGHSLPSLDDQSFDSESPYEYLQSLYAPVDKDVRCNSNSKIIVKKRPQYGQQKQHKIDFNQILELNPTVAYNYEEMDKIELSNNFKVVQPLEMDEISYKTNTSIESNTKPWFKGGYTETETTKWLVGDTLVHEEIVQKGYVPTVDSWSEDDQKADQCDDGSFDTKSSNPIPVEWGLVKKETFSVTASMHKSGARLIEKEEKWVEGKKVERGEGNQSGQFKIYEGIIEYNKTEYENTAQINPEICEKDYIHLMTRKIEENYGFTKSVFGFRLQNKTITTYVPITESSLGLTSFVGTSQKWKKTVKKGEYSQDDETFIVQPDKTSEGENPPNSKWIRPPKKEINAFTTVNDDRVTEFTGKPESKEAPFCFNMRQLETLGKRILEENNGLAKSIEIVLPYHYTVSLGDSVRYTDRDGDVSYYLVQNISINQDLSDSLKTLLLRRVNY